MKNAIQIVANLISAQRAGEKVVKKDFAAKYDISPRTLNRYEAKYQAQAQASLDDDKMIDRMVDDLNNTNTRADITRQQKVMKGGVAVQNNQVQGFKKKDVAVEIFKNMEGAKRKEIIAEFMDKAGLTKAGAGTYYYNIKKEMSQ